MMTRSRRTLLFSWGLFSFLSALLYGALSCRSIGETDVFLQIRAGEEIFQTHSIQKMNTWSSVSYGKPWVNYQWLSCVIFYLFKLMAPHYAGLVILRGICVFVLFLVVNQVIRDCSKTLRSAIVTTILITPIVFLSSFWRLGIRPELLTLILFVSMIWIWIGRAKSDLKPLLGFFALILWANLHIGTLPLGIYLQISFLLYEKVPDRFRFQKKTFYGLLTLSTLFLSPMGFNVFKFFTQIGRVVQSSVIDNPDMQAMQTRFFRFDFGGLTYSIWMFFLVGCLIVFCFGKKNRFQLPGAYRNRIFLGATGFGFLLLAFLMARTVAFHVLFCLPFVAACIAQFLEARKFSVQQLSRYAIYTMVVWTLLIWVHWQSPFVLPFYLSPDPLTFPIRSVEFITRINPEGKMFNTFNLSGYLIDALPKYLVSTDLRQDLFVDFEREMKELQKNPIAYQARLKDLHFNFLVLNHQNPILLNGRIINPHRIYYPPSEWALVFFDRASEVYLRRIPEHTSFISRYEYRRVDTWQPFSYGRLAPNLTEEARKEFETEFDRCVQLDSTNGYCMAGKASFVKKSGNLEKAKELFKRANESWPEVGEIESALAELESI